MTDDALDAWAARELIPRLNRIADWSTRNLYTVNGCVEKVSQRRRPPGSLFCPRHLALLHPRRRS